jgi:hypothetical protein
MGTYTELSKLNSKEFRQKENSQINDQITQDITQTRNNSRGKSIKTSRSIPRDLPSRDDIQKFSFHLRDQLKVKVQAEVPYKWQKELEEIARHLNVKKLELYRFIIGEFIGKVKRTGK